MITTYDEATAKIANAEQLRKLRDERNYVKTTMKAGANCAESSFMPLILSRKLGHNELIFNMSNLDNTYLQPGAQAKWTLSDTDDCWICDRWKYCLVFFSRKHWKQHYYLIDDPVTLRNLSTQHSLGNDEYKQVHNKDYPIIFGSITENNICQMSDISLFNLFLDNRKIRKEFGSQTSSTVMN